jgi:hypothetical protein
MTTIPFTSVVIVKPLRDKDGRQLAEIFLELPLKKDYPDYYETIKKPISFEQIQVSIS